MNQMVLFLFYLLIYLFNYLFIYCFFIVNFLLGLHIIFFRSVYDLVRFLSWLVMLLVVMFCGSFIGKGTATRRITADNSTRNANTNQMSLRATSFHFSFDVIIVSFPGVLTTLSLSRGA